MRKRRAILLRLLLAGMSLGSGTVMAAAPIANPDSATTETGRTVSIRILVNDRDPDGDIFIVGSFPAATRPKNGTVVRRGRFADYTPSPGFTGTDTFAYRLKDSTGAWSRAATVTVTVAPAPNATPVAAADAGNTTAPDPVTMDLLANDTDADGDTLSITANTAPANGTVSRSGASVTYTPAAGFSGTDTFAYTLSDGRGGSTSGSVSITVTEATPLEPTVGSASLSWTIPATRADGTPLSMAEISGYEIYLLAESTGQTSVISIDSGSTTSYTVSGLTPDTYHFSMATKDAHGNLSELSATVTKVIGP